MRYQETPSRMQSLANTIKFGNKASTVADTALIGTAALVGAGLFLGFSPNSQEQFLSNPAICGALITGGIGVAANATSFISREIALVKAAGRRDPLSLKYQHAEGVRWIKRGETIVTGLSFVGIVVPILGETVFPALAGLGVLGYVGLRAWSFAANRAVKKEIKRQGL